jgi:hypothetical protein
MRTVVSKLHYHERYLKTATPPPSIERRRAAEARLGGSK